ncbi:MAG: ABC transporter permease [Propionibacteriaceae bacterium]|nr:ABC transporter permease [Propionibacteriaceae bacterium]
MGKYVVRRLLMMIPTFLGATLLIYFLAYAMPGDPTAGRCGDRQCPPSYVAWFRAHYGLDKPFLEQYWMYIQNLFRGDLGVNYYQNTVVHELAIRYPTTIKLAVIAVLCEIIIGMAAGILAGISKGKFIDSLVTVSTLVVIAIPVFVLGSLAQMVFGIKLKWFAVTAGDGTWRQLLLPGLVLGSLYIAYVARLTRTNLIENLRADYVRTAKAKGMSTTRAFGVHALRNSLVPSITYIGASFGGMMGGAIVTERIFNINGIGGLIWRSINQRDGTTLVGAVVVLVLIYMFMTLIVDIIYSWLDPRISHE